MKNKNAIKRYGGIHFHGRAIEKFLPISIKESLFLSSSHRYTFYLHIDSHDHEKQRQRNHQV